jgi:hypothetical protein
MQSYQLVTDRSIAGQSLQELPDAGRIEERVAVLAQVRLPGGARGVGGRVLSMVVPTTTARVKNKGARKLGNRRWSGNRSATRSLSGPPSQARTDMERRETELIRRIPPGTSPLSTCSVKSSLLHLLPSKSSYLFRDRR